MWVHVFILEVGSIVNNFFQLYLYLDEGKTFKKLPSTLALRTTFDS